MGLNRYKLGELIETVNETNSDLKYSKNDVVGITITKEIIPTKANISSADLSNFTVIKPNTFIYNPRTHGKKIGFGYNNTKNTYIISFNNMAFKIKESMKKVVLSDYLFLHFRRDEWDREACYNSWGSSTEVFSWDAICEMIVELPSVKIQQKYIDIYNGLVENQKSYERGLDDLKLTCDAYIDTLKHKNKQIPISEFIVQIDNRNAENFDYKFKGLSMDNYFIDSIADDTGINFSGYKIVAPKECGAVLMKVGRDCRLTIARNDSNENYLISPAYYTFKVHDINSNYFMANVNRAEFERKGWFSCDSSARGSLPWNDFINLTIPKANKEEQLIVSNLYDSLIIRLEINEQLKTQIKEICPILIKGSIEEGRKEA